MFKSFRIGYAERIVSTDIPRYKYQYIIIDSDFEQVSIKSEHCPHIAGSLFGEVVIDIYEERMLPVAPNLALALSYYGCLYKGASRTDVVIQANKLYNPKFKKYEQEIGKYLVLL